MLKIKHIKNGYSSMVNIEVKSVKRALNSLKQVYKHITWLPLGHNPSSEVEDSIIIIIIIIIIITTT
jgi:hypothetical protein